MSNIDFQPTHLQQSQTVNQVDDRASTEQFTKLPNAAEYKGSSYANAIRIERGISLEKAFEIAQSDPNIEYFFHVKGYCMVLEIPPETDLSSVNDPLELLSYSLYQYDNGDLNRGYARIFRHGDTVFFTKASEKWLGSAPGLADVYVRQ